MRYLKIFKFDFILVWEKDEIVHLIVGRRLFSNNWKKIKMTFKHYLVRKSTVQLKDKWRSVGAKRIKYKSYYNLADEVISKIK